MTIYIDDHPFHYETENLVRLFFPNEKMTTVSDIPNQPEMPYILTSMKINRQNATAYISADVCIGEFHRFSDVELDTDGDTLVLVLL